MMQATRHYDSAASSRATSPSLPLLSGFPVAEWDNSPSLPYSRQEKRQRHCAPAPRTLLPLAVAALFFPALLYLLLANPASTSSYLDRLRVSVALGPNQGGGKLWSLMHAPPAQALDEGGFVVVDATAEHTVTAIVLHGLSGSAWDWPFAQTLAQRYPYVKWVSPTADYMDVTVRDGENTRAWFNIKTFDDLYDEEDVAGYVHSQQQITRLIDEERQRLVSQGKEPRIVLCGFSQGGVMTLLQALTADSPNRFEAAVVFSTYLPIPNEIEDLIPPANHHTPIFWGHGLADPYLTIEHARDGVEQLTERVGMEDLTFKTYEGLQHGWAAEELEDLAQWFATKVPAARLRSPSAVFASSSSPSLPAATVAPLAAVRPAAVPAMAPAPVPVVVADAVEKVDKIEVVAELPARRRGLRKVKKSVAHWTDVIS